MLAAALFGHICPVKISTAPDVAWEIKVLPQNNFKAENPEYDSGVLYIIENS